MTARAAIAGALTLLSPILAPAAENALPEPLTLEFALSLATEAHPKLMRAEASLAGAAAQADEQSARTGLDIGIDAAARWLEPPAPLSGLGNEDHRARLYAKKRLYDFGRTSHLTAAAKAQAEAQKLAVTDTLSQRRIEIMERYFDVLLADLEFAHHNENMATSFLRYDRTRERKDVGQHSEFEVAQTFSDSQAVRAKRYTAQLNQRAARARLAIALNRPGQLSQKLTTPRLPAPPASLPDVEDLQRQAYRDNPVLLTLRAQLQAAQERRAAARAQYFPVIDADAEIGKYTRDVGANDHWRAGVSLNIPLYQGGRTGAQVDQAQADIQRISADLLDQERTVAEAVLEAWLQLNALKFQRDETRALLDYRQRYLDRSRTLYEQDVRADLGDAMVELTSAEMRNAQTDYRIALVLARLDAMTGKNNSQGAVKP